MLSMVSTWDGRPTPLPVLTLTCSVVSPGLEPTMQADWHSIASQLGSLGLQQGLACACDGAWTLVEDQSRAGVVGNWDPTKMEPRPNATAVSLQESTAPLKHARYQIKLVGNMAFVEELLNISFSSSHNLHSSETFSG